MDCTFGQKKKLKLKQGALHLDKFAATETLDVKIAHRYHIVLRFFFSMNTQSCIFNERFERYPVPQRK